MILLTNILMINELRDSILIELKGLDSVAEIYDWIPKKFWGFPSIYFTFDRIESNSLDSHTLDRTYYFTINVFQETTTNGNIQSERNLSDLLDDIINIFDESDLGGLAMYIEEVGGNIQPVETDNWPALHAIVVLAIHTAYSPYI